uniref:Uncharacterized protein n=1 Tax=Rhizophora mucronata TaxID=61149 RepID=A0A2P2KNL8_RHIMU
MNHILYFNNFDHLYDNVLKTGLDLLVRPVK